VALFAAHFLTERESNYFAQDFPEQGTFISPMAVTIEVGKTVGIVEIMECLPHRYPMLLVDRLVEVSENSCVGIKNVTINESFFQGHYPGNPIMPGVLILEAMAQTGAIILLSLEQYKNTIPVIGAIDDAKFRRQVVPGDQLRMKVDLLWIKASVGRIKTVATVDGELAASMEMTFKLMKREPK
jgi:beta-hydroxyacyl-ACP dehydratase FabZ